MYQDIVFHLTYNGIIKLAYAFTFGYGCYVFGIAPHCMSCCCTEYGDWLGHVSSIVLQVLGAEPWILVQYSCSGPLLEDSLLTLVMHCLAAGLGLLISKGLVF